MRGLGVVGAQPLLQPGESYEYTSGTVDRHAGRHDARQLPDGGRGRHALRGADPRVHAFGAARPALITCGFFGQVNQTMKTARRARAATSRKTTHMRADLPAGDCTGAPARRSPEPCPVCPPPKPAPETAQYVETRAFAALPGWAARALEPSLRAFLAGCARASGAPAGRACAHRPRPCRRATRRRARQFFEATLRALRARLPRNGRQRH